MALKKGEIEVSKKTLLHISEGIYRTEGSSIKELISNAFDAQATRVSINTNYPVFDVLSCQDDGGGMTEKEFIRIVQGGIGDSPKATLIDNGSLNRPIIGKLGIGILAIAQICRSFTVISHHQKSKTAFKGTMVFRTDVDKVAKDIKIQESTKDQGYEIGTWTLEERLDYNEAKKGVLIFTKDLRQSYIKRFRDNDIIRNMPLNDSPLDFASLLNKYYQDDVRSIKQLGPYYELIWEICQLSPLPYFDKGPLRREIKNKIENYNDNQILSTRHGVTFLKEKQGKLEKYNFSVFFDDIKLYRPLKLPYPLYRNDRLQECQVFYLEYNNIVRKRPLHFSFYCFAQENAIRPRDLKGIQIRIKNVGIGLHDATFLNYDKIESPRDNWVTGEIFVEAGLESALNIDRDSFNENDEHYYILKQEVHTFLTNSVFPVIKATQRKRNIAQKNTQQLERITEIKSALEQFFSTYLGYKVEFLKEGDLEVLSKRKELRFPESILGSSFKIRRDFFATLAIEIIPSLHSAIHNKKDAAKALSTLSSLLLF